MISELEFDPRDYHLRVMIEQMQRNGRSEDAIEKAVRTASGRKPSAKTPASRTRDPGNRLRGFKRSLHRLRPSGLRRY